MQLNFHKLWCTVSDQQWYHFCFGETEICLRGLPTRCVLGKSNKEFNYITSMCECWDLPIPLSLSARLPQAEFTPKGHVCIFHSSNMQTGRSKWLLKALVQHTGSGVSVCTSHVRAVPASPPCLWKPRGCGELFLCTSGVKGRSKQEGKIQHLARR